MLKNTFLNVVLPKLDVWNQMVSTFNSFNFKMNFDIEAGSRKDQMIGNLFSPPESITSITVVKALKTKRDSSLKFNDMTMLVSYENQEPREVFVSNKLVQLMYSKFRIDASLKHNIQNSKPDYTLIA